MARESWLGHGDAGSQRMSEAEAVRDDRIEWRYETGRAEPRCHEHDRAASGSGSWARCRIAR